ncbi:MAG: response regulator transcription factor [Anaerolineae bacterium]|nr:response regulator transcription factor [Anaerolineae bacterium]
MKALLISQDPDETAVVSLALQRAGLNVARYRDVPDPVPFDADDPTQLIVLATPEGSPLPGVKAIRAQEPTPLVVIAEHLDESTHTITLESGADLVIQRPFSARLLIAQIRALLRRAANLPLFTLPTLSVHDVELDPGTRTVVVAGRSPKRLTHLEYRLLYTLMIHKEQVLPAEVLVEQVWGFTGDGERDLVRGLIRRLRIKVEADPRHPEHILTIPGVGYTFSPES